MNILPISLTSILVVKTTEFNFTVHMYVPTSVFESKLLITNVLRMPSELSKKIVERLFCKRNEQLI